MSVWHRPLASMRTRIWPAPGSGIGTSLMASGSSKPVTTAARMVGSLLSTPVIRIDALDSGDQDRPRRTPRGRAVDHGHRDRTTLPGRSTSTAATTEGLKVVWHAGLPTNQFDAVVG